jgi:isoquinoline 1-oxidoreductase subunit beta
MLIAEELDADWAKVRVEQAVADRQYGDQKTDGSSSVSDTFSYLRFVGASVRALFVAAAAQTWGVDQSTCRTEKGVVIHTLSGKRLPYGDLIGVASTFDPSSVSLAVVKLKQTEQFTLIRNARTTGGYTPKNRWKCHLWFGCPLARNALRNHRSLPNSGWYSESCR